MLPPVIDLKFQVALIFSELYEFGIHPDLECMSLNLSRKLCFWSDVGEWCKYPVNTNHSFMAIFRHTDYVPGGAALF